MTQTTNPLMNILPSSYDVRLPSQGIPYKINNTITAIFEENAISENGTIQVRPLTTKDELIWTDKRLVEELKAPMIILSNIVSGIKRPDLLLRSDVEHILVWARIFTYGDQTNISWTCNKCGHENESQVSYKNLPIHIINNDNDLVLETSFQNNTYNITMIPLIFKEAVEIQKANDNDDISEQLDKLISCIYSVKVTNDTTSQLVDDKAFIAEWVENLNPKLFRTIIEFFKDINNVGTIMEMDVKCGNCGAKEKTDIMVDLTNFFSEED